MRLCADSTNVAHLVETFEHEGETILITDLYKGGDLLQYLLTRDVSRLPELEAGLIVLQIARGIKDIHDGGVVHRDIKHLNIFLSDVSKTPNVRIGDFGLSTRMSPEEAKQKNLCSGTVGYMAPELILGATSDFKVDVWSLGVILYALICSNMPFEGGNKDELGTSIV